MNCQSTSFSNTGCKDRILLPKLVKRDPSKQIRQQYLRKLGFVNDRNPTLMTYSTSSSSFLSNSSRSDISLQRFSYQDDLNDCESYISSSSTSWSRKLGTSPTTIIGFKSTTRRTVSFSTKVDVHLIPHKDMFSERIKKLIWSEADELAENAQRNSIEFASENWDWRQACEEDNFFICPETGNKIHPAHVHWLDQIMAKRLGNRHLANFQQCPVRF